MPPPPAPNGVSLDDEKLRGRVVVADDSYVYVANESGTLVRVPATLAGPIETIATGSFGSLVDAGDELIGIRFRDSENSVVRIPKGGGAAVVVAVTSATAVRVRGDRVFVLVVDGGGSLENPQRYCHLATVPRTGGELTTLSPIDSCGDFVVDDDAAYATSENRVLRVPLDGSAVTTLATASSGIYGLAQDDDRIWLLVPDRGQIAWFGKRDGSSGELPASLWTRALVVDHDDLFWIETDTENASFESGTLVKLSKHGGAKTTVLGPVASASALAVNVASVFTVGMGPIYRAPR